MALTRIEYIQLVLGSLELIKTEIIEVVAPDSLVNTRYIASEGRDDESWLGYLRDTDGTVDRWLLTISGFHGLDRNAQTDDPAPVGTFTKPISVVVDYYADYQHGLDAVGAIGSETVTNTEREFLKKVLGVDFELEQRYGCLNSNILIKDWDFQLKLRRFNQATTHWASGVINLEFTDLILA